MLSIKNFTVAIVAIALAGCSAFTETPLSQDQTSELLAHVQVYHLCVAHAAKQLEDGRSPISQIAASAVHICQPEAQNVAGFLDSTKLSDKDKATYVGDLIQTATNKSAVMLRHLRDREEGFSDI